MTTPTKPDLKCRCGHPESDHLTFVGGYLVGKGDETIPAVDCRSAGQWNCDCHMFVAGRKDGRR